MKQTKISALYEPEINKFIKNCEESDQYQKWALLFQTPLFHKISRFVSHLMYLYDLDNSENFLFSNNDNYQKILMTSTNLVLAVNNHLEINIFDGDLEILQANPNLRNQYLGLSEDCMKSLDLSQNLIYSITHYFCLCFDTKKDFEKILLIIANFIEMCIINEATEYIVKKVLIFKKEKLNSKTAMYYLNAQMEGFQRIKDLLKTFLIDYLNEIILLINTLNQRPK